MSASGTGKQRKTGMTSTWTCCECNTRNVMIPGETYPTCKNTVVVLKIKGRPVATDLCGHGRCGCCQWELKMFESARHEATAYLGGCSINCSNGSGTMSQWNGKVSRQLPANHPNYLLNHHDCWYRQIYTHTESQPSNYRMTPPRTGAGNSSYSSTPTQLWAPFPPPTRTLGPMAADVTCGQAKIYGLFSRMVSQEAYTYQIPTRGPSIACIGAMIRTPSYPTTTSKAQSPFMQRPLNAAAQLIRSSSSSSSRGPRLQTLQLPSLERRYSTIPVNAGGLERRVGNVKLCRRKR
ncbi:hypothetical protein DFP73DRAFT_588511 [Morchella snyderi]|nr:hypothetical protein DFP73DRAFT_588511 [Morchella snyderi]